jgi:ABC-type glutathione transport system ATPase component
MSTPVIEVADLRTHIVTRWGTIKAVDSVSFAVGEGETLGLVGESGSGKSMTCLSVLRLVPRPAARIVGGRVLLDGDDLLQKSEREMQPIRGKRAAMILQDPMSSLNPVFSVVRRRAEVPEAPPELLNPVEVDRIPELQTESDPVLVDIGGDRPGPGALHEIVVASEGADVAGNLIGRSESE